MIFVEIKRVFVMRFSEEEKEKKHETIDPNFYCVLGFWINRTMDKKFETVVENAYVVLSQGNFDEIFFGLE